MSNAARALLVVGWIGVAILALLVSRLLIILPGDSVYVEGYPGIRKVLDQFGDGRYTVSDPVADMVIVEPSIVHKIR